jgi:hypothetical protein
MTRNKSKKDKKSEAKPDEKDEKERNPRACHACWEAKDISFATETLRLCRGCHEQWQGVRRNAASTTGVVTRYCHACGTAIQLDPAHPGCGQVVCICGETHQMIPKKANNNVVQIPDILVIGLLLVGILTVVGMVCLIYYLTPEPKPLDQVICKAALTKLEKMQYILEGKESLYTGTNVITPGHPDYHPDIQHPSQKTE